MVKNAEANKYVLRSARVYFREIYRYVGAVIFAAIKGGVNGVDIVVALPLDNNRIDLNVIVSGNVKGLSYRDMGLFFGAYGSNPGRRVVFYHGDGGRGYCRFACNLLTCYGGNRDYGVVVLYAYLRVNIAERTVVGFGDKVGRGYNALFLGASVNAVAFAVGNAAKANTDFAHLGIGVYIFGGKEFKADFDLFYVAAEVGVAVIFGVEVLGAYPVGVGGRYGEVDTEGSVGGTVALGKPVKVVAYNPVKSYAYTLLGNRRSAADCQLVAQHYVGVTCGAVYLNCKVILWRAAKYNVAYKVVTAVARFVDSRQ